MAWGKFDSSQIFQKLEISMLQQKIGKNEPKKSMKRERKGEISLNTIRDHYFLSKMRKTPQSMCQNMLLVEV